MQPPLLKTAVSLKTFQCVLLQCVIFFLAACKIVMLKHFMIKHSTSGESLGQMVKCFLIVILGLFFGPAIGTEFYTH